MSHDNTPPVGSCWVKKAFRRMAVKFHPDKVRDMGADYQKQARTRFGAMSGDTSKGVFVTTSAFSAKAVDKADSAHHRIILIDGNKLADLMYEFEVGIQVKEVYPVKELDDDFFSA